MKVIVAVLTYKRPEMLRNCLRALLRPEVVPRDTAILIVDNDPAESGRDVVASFESESLTYVCEPTPGIVAGRNRAMEYARANDFAHLAFIDDDECAGPGWIDHLSRTLAATDALAVFGPVHPLLDEHAPRWIDRGGFFDRPRAATGSPVKWPATNNVLMDLSRVAELGDFMFDEAFSLTGGSDTDFFDRLRRKGASLVWCDEAVVTEEVPSTRANARWLWRRGVRLGNVSARMQLRRRSFPQVIAIGIARTVLALPLVLVGLLRERRLLAVHAMHLPKGVGMLQAATGNYIHEYARARR